MIGTLEEQEKRERLSVEDKESGRKQRLQDRRGGRRKVAANAFLGNFIMS